MFDQLSPTIWYPALIYDVSQPLLDAIDNLVGQFFS
jgi:hypothetical protein